MYKYMIINIYIYMMYAVFLGDLNETKVHSGGLAFCSFCFGSLYSLSVS